MMKLIAPLVLTSALALTGCAAASTSSSTSGSSSGAEEVAQAPDLQGDWKQSNPESDDAYQQATITADTITIEWVSDGGSTTAIYWVGTFEAPNDATEPYVWTSDRDEEATDSALLASTADSKDFTFAGGAISYELSALGVTTIVEMKKN